MIIALSERNTDMASIHTASILSGRRNSSINTTAILPERTKSSTHKFNIVLMARAAADRQLQHCFGEVWGQQTHGFNTVWRCTASTQTGRRKTVYTQPQHFL